MNMLFEVVNASNDRIALFAWWDDANALCDYLENKYGASYTVRELKSE